MGASADGTPFRARFRQARDQTAEPGPHHVRDHPATAYFECVAGMLDGGADAILIETSQDLLQVKAAVVAARRTMAELGRSIPIISHVTVKPPAPCCSVRRSGRR